MIYHTHHYLYIYLHTKIKWLLILSVTINHWTIHWLLSTAHTRNDWALIYQYLWLVYYVLWQILNQYAKTQTSMILCGKSIRSKSLYPTYNSIVLRIYNIYGMSTPFPTIPYCHATCWSDIFPKYIMQHSNLPVCPFLVI